MKRSQIYREAAQLLESEQACYHWSCWTICQALNVPFYNEGEPKPAEVTAYEELFSPEILSRDSGVRNRWGLFWDDQERNGCRILALCFMAALTEWDEKHGS